MNDIFDLIFGSPELSFFLLATATTVAGYVGKVIVSLIQRKLNAEQIRVLLAVARTAVLAAEQTGAAASAEEKKARALAIAQTYLTAYGIKVSAAQLDAAIEASVLAELAKVHLPEPATSSEAP